MASKRLSQAWVQGQWAGRCSRLAERASRAGTEMRCRRMVALVARACQGEARAPAARVRLNAIVASASQAAFAVNLPEVIWSHPAGVRDVREEGFGSAGPRRGCGYLSSSITTAEGVRCGCSWCVCRSLGRNAALATLGGL